MTLRVVMTLDHYIRDEEECRKVGAELFTIPCKTEDELIAATQDADAILTFWITRKVISKLRKCKLLHNIGTGYDGIDVEAATEYGICVSFPGDYCSEEVSEHVMALILACARKLVRLDRQIKEGKWASVTRAQKKELLTPMFQIKGQTLGIISFGRIGRLIVPKAKGFGMRVIAFDPYVPSVVFKESGVESVTLDQLLRESDFVSVNAALTEETRHLLGIEEFRKMKPTAYFINCARASIADEGALYTALTHGYIAGAGIDVVEGESFPLDHPFLKLENVILTPHSAFFSEYSISEIKRRAYEHLGQIFRGEWPTWFVNPEVKERFLERWGKA
ncbi:Hydroxypyruvate reductase [subsurface metagenome]